MSISKYNIYLSFLFIFASFSTVAQTISPSGNYRHFTIDDGLSNNFISSLIQDQYGFIWIGTANGLNRFDGYDFVHYKNKIGDPTSISNNYINAICLDSNGFMWIATNNGLNRYDSKTETFTQFRHRDKDSNSIADNQVTSVYEDEKGYLWIGAFRTLDRLDPRTGIFTHYSIPHSIITDESLEIESIIEYDNDMFLSVWGVGVYRFHRETEQFTPIKIVHKKTMPKNWLHNFYIDKKRNLLATDGKLMRFSSTTNSFDPVKDGVEDREDISIDCIIETRNGKYLTSAGDNDFYLYNSNFEFESSDVLDKTNDANTNHLKVLFATQAGELWIGTALNGLYLWDANRKKFNNYEHQPDNNNSIAAGPVSNICCMKSGKIWMGSRLNGISVFDPQKQTFYHINPQKKGLNSNYVQSIFEDRKGNKWIGTWGGGLNKIDVNTGSYTYFKKGNDAASSLCDNFVSAICQSPDNKIWVATTRGISVIDASKKQPLVKSFVYEPRSNKCPSGLRTDVLLCDHTGAVWIGTEANGLNRYNPSSGTFDYFNYDFNNVNSLGSNKVSAIFEDSKNRLWIGCPGGGLNLFIPEKKCFTHYDEKDGLPGNEIKGITEDKDGILWITSDKGISRFDTKTKKFQHYNTGDGLSGNQFYVQSICKSPVDGKIYAGTINGMVSFYPDSIISNKLIPRVYISSLKVFQTKGKQTDIEYIRGIQHLNNITLSSTQNTFALNFLSLSYSSAEKNQYSYKLEGLNESWIDLGAARDVTFSNLPPGDYLLHVKGSNSDGVWNEKGTTLTIKILPPWWLTWWAYTCYALALATFIYGYIRLRIKRGITKVIEQQALRTKISSDLHDDVGSILSGLAMQSQMLTFTAKEEQKKSLNEISNMSRDAMEHMRDTVWAIDSRKDKYENLIDRMRAFAEKNLAMKNMKHEFVIAGIDTKKFIDPEKRQAIYLIFKEAITNIIKHCDGKHVSISFANEKNNLLLVVKDSGTKKEDCNSDGLGVSNMKMRAEKIGGKLSIKYENGFVVELRMP